MADSCSDNVVNVVLAGLGGQGVLKASDVLADAAFAAGRDVKKSEIHGMSQRGGSVTSDVRFGPTVLSPMVPAGRANYLVVIAPDQAENNRPLLAPDGVLLSADRIDPAALPHPRSVNVALMGLLSLYLDFPESAWQEALRRNFPDKLLELNQQAFALGRRTRRP